MVNIFLKIVPCLLEIAFNGLFIGLKNNAYLIEAVAIDHMQVKHHALRGHQLLQGFYQHRSINLVKVNKVVVFER